MSILKSVLSSLPVLFVLLFGSVSLLFAVLRRGARLDPPSWYAGENVLGVALAPLCVILLAASAGAAVEMVGSWGNTPLGEKHLPEAAALGVLFTVAVAWVARATPRAAAPAGAEKVSAQVVALTLPAADAGPEQGPSTPTRPANRAA